MRLVDADKFDEQLALFQTILFTSDDRLWARNKPLFQAIAQVRRIIAEELPTVDIKYCPHCGERLGVDKE